MAMHIRRLRRIPERVLKEIPFAAPPPKFPRGFFDALVTPTRQLLDKGLKLMQAADWLIARGVLKESLRQRYSAAMRCRLTRLRRKIEASPAAVQWRTSIFYDSMHLLPAGGLKALCGAHATRWNALTEPLEKCSRCKGIATREKVAIEGEKP